jgi:MFS family permease
MSARENTTSIPVLAKVSSRQVWFASVICFAAWTFGVYDFVLFGMLLPEIGREMEWSPTTQAEIATWIAVGTVFVALGVGPFLDRFGRKAGLMLTVGGAGICSALTAMAGAMGLLPLILIRAASGLGYSEQGVNGAYLSELYNSADSSFIVRWRGRIFSIVQGGWPVGAMLAAWLTSILLPRVGWEGCFIVAAVPSLIIAFLARFLRESPAFEALREQRKRNPTSVQHSGSFFEIFKGDSLRPSIVLGMTHTLNWFSAQTFGILGTTVLMNVHHIDFGNSLLVLVFSNLAGFIGYLVHGYLGDKFGRRNVISAGWMICSLSFGAMLFVPSDFWTVTALYSLGQFFSIGPYACLLFFVGESFPNAAVRGRGSSFVVGIGPVGGIIAAAGTTWILANSGSWQSAALYLGAVPCFLSALCVLFAKSTHGAKELNAAPAFQ